MRERTGTFLKWTAAGRGGGDHLAVAQFLELKHAEHDRELRVLVGGEYTACMAGPRVGGDDAPQLAAI